MPQFIARQTDTRGKKKNRFTNTTNVAAASTNAHCGRRAETANDVELGSTEVGIVVAGESFTEVTASGGMNASATKEVATSSERSVYPAAVPLFQFDSDHDGPPSPRAAVSSLRQTPNDAFE
jgi:hypothetical protein